MSDFGFSRGRFVAGGRFEAPPGSDASVRRRLAEEDAIDAGYARANGETSTAEDIRKAYAAKVEAQRAVDPKTTGVDVEHTRDLRAFEAAVCAFGYVPAVRALKVLSPLAQEKDRHYWAARKKAGR